MSNPLSRPQPRIAKRRYSQFKKTILNDAPRMIETQTLTSNDDTFYRYIFDHSRSPKLIFDPLNLKIIEANSAACQFYGYPLEHLKTLSIIDINTLPEQDVKNIAQSVAGGTRTIIQTGHRLASGAIRDVEIFAALLDVGDKNYLYAEIHDITERLQNEKAVRESEALYRLLAQNMPDSSVVMFDRDMRYTLVEGPFLKRFGTVSKSMVGKTAQETLLTQEAIDFIVPIYQRILQGESFSYDRETDEYAYEAHATPLRDENGQIIGGMILSHDVTECRQTADALRESEQRYQSVISTMSEGIVVQNQDGIIQTCNPAAERILGLTADQMMGRTSIDPLWRAVHEDGSPFPGETHPAMVTLRTGQPLSNVIMGVHKPDNSLAWICINSRALIHPDQTQPYAVVATFVDITERKMAVDALRTSEERLRLITDNVQDVITLTDAEDRIIFASPSSKSILGFEPQALLGKLREDFAPPEEQLKLTNLRQNLISVKQQQITRQGRLVHADGHVINIETVGKFLFDDQSNYVGSVYITRDVTERKRLEQALLASEERLRLITDNIQDLVTLSDAEDRIIFASPSAQSILGFEPQTMLGKFRKEFVPSDERPKMIANLQNLIAAKQQQLTGEGQIVHADGHVINVEIVGKLLFDDQSNYLGCVDITRDITERKRMEQALLASEERLRLITDNMQDIVLQSDQTGRIVFVSPSFFSVLGFELNSLSSVSIIEYIHPDDQALVTQAFQTAIETNAAQFLTEYRLHHADGHYLDVETATNILKDDQANFTGAVFVTRDITERKRMEEALRSSEAKLRLIADNLHDLVTQNDLHGRLAFVSQSSRTMLGHEPESLLDTPSLSLIHPDDRPAMGKIFRNAYETRAPQFTLEARLRHVDGHYIPVETVGQFVFDDQSNITSGVFISRDITERKRLQKLLLEQEKIQTSLEKEHELNLLKTHMMQRIAHEFRTPLAVIQALMETLTYYYDRLSADQKIEKTAKVKKHIQHITDMLDEIGLVVKSDFEPDDFQPVPTDLSLLCREVAASLETYFGLPHKYVLDLPETTPLVADPTVLKTALLHIMRNAARFCEPSAAVTVRLSHLENTIELCVTDTGIGILPNELSRIFDPFFRGSNINERSGLGIGLTLARAAIAAHDGTITVQSVPLQGTTFTITLPLS